MRISDWSSDVCSSDLGDEPAAHLAGAGQLTVIGVELLVQHEEAAHLAARELRVAGEVAVHPRDLALDDLDDPGIGSEFLIAAIGHVVALGPATHRGQVDIDEDGAEIALMAEGDGLLDVREEL